MSSSFLYVAIVVIWACLLVPKWLQRDSAAAGWHEFADLAAGDDAAATATAVDEAATAVAAPAGLATVNSDATAGGANTTVAPPRTSSRAMANDGEAFDDVPVAGRDHAATGDHTGRRRVLRARRRTLGLLVVLVVTASTLAGIHRAVWWTVGPPAVLLLGYLVALRGAGRADARRRRAEAEERRRMGAAAPSSPVVVPGYQPPRDAEILPMSVHRSSPAAPPPDDAEPERDRSDAGECYGAPLRAVGD